MGKHFLVYWAIIEAHKSVQLQPQLERATFPHSTIPFGNVHRVDRRLSWVIGYRHHQGCLPAVPRLQIDKSLTCLNNPLLLYADQLQDQFKTNLKFVKASSLISAEIENISETLLPLRIELLNWSLKSKATETQSWSSSATDEVRYSEILGTDKL